METPHLPHYEDHQSPQLPHHLGAVPPHKQEVVGQPGGGGGGQHPYNQFLPFFPHFLQNFQRQQQQHQQTNGILDHNQSASSKMVRMCTLRIFFRREATSTDYFVPLL